MSSQALIRPAWTPATIALMVGGFFVFWPLGLAVLAYILWGDRLESFKRDVNLSTDRFMSGVKRSGMGKGFGFERTGNVAFDDWREKELSRLDEERRRLNEAAAEFEEYARELRRAKDQEEFDRFMSDRRRRETNHSGPVVDGQPA
ncbi:Protein of unknown function [Fulvimarina manganoxydans]|uniref:DUF2852 domain-containing protein n=1 Tax=Fulvimarina manganoxydans TaxID=937218 RepID=A0A1W2BET7_9HYPH|nr:DUF2852 domain-containing protein [Fulvimarina manganoxydans]MCK5932871.1 DUF2852 domain-containing protein [Fulvimarina manganoxydans]SMC71232.1 Protein of unknown function [Fulvimarina manganoxydans]